MMILGHRGASSEVQENTLAAFVRARELGADGVELDVRRTGDGLMVVHHDPHLPNGVNVVDLQREEFPEHLAELRTALEACAPMFVNIEIKNVPVDPDWDEHESVAAGVAALVVELDMRDRVIVSSFGIGAIDAVHAIDPSIPTAWLTPSGYDQFAAIETAMERGHSALHPHFSVVTDALVVAAHEAALLLNTWTVDDAEDMKRFDAMGVDTIVTNDVALAVKTLR